MILHKIMDAKAPCGTHRSGAVEVVSISDFAEPFGSAFFLPRGCAVPSVKATHTPYVILSPVRAKDPVQQFNTRV